MDSLSTPASCQRQGSQQSTTPLLDSLPSVEDRIQENQDADRDQSSSNGFHVISSTGQLKGTGADEASSINGSAPQQSVNVEMERQECKGTQANDSSVATSESGKEMQVSESATYLKRGTSIPIREEFRCRRFWFFYHDIRAFTTSVSSLNN